MFHVPGGITSVLFGSAAYWSPNVALRIFKLLNRTKQSPAAAAAAAAVDGYRKTVIFLLSGPLICAALTSSPWH